jgi:uncharacterized protein YeaO (DUF488 family)
MLKVYTSNMDYNGIDRLDITVKTGDLDFAPTWDMVIGHKNGTLSNTEYINRYLEILRTTSKTNRKKWLNIINREEVTFICYCKKGKFCHRKILAKVFDSFDNVKYMGER